MDNQEIIRVTFYKPQDLWGHLVSWWTGLFNPDTPAYSHVEMGFLINGEWQYYSSASKNTNGTTGTRWLKEAVLLAHPERWDVYEVEAVRPVEDMIKTCDEELGKEYDFLGLWGFVTIFGLLNDKLKWYCSEICHYIFFGIWRKRVSPRRYFSEIKEHIVKLIQFA